MLPLPAAISLLAAGRPSPIALGTLFTDTNFSAGSKYTVSGSGITFSGGQINMTGGSATFNDYISLTDATNSWINTTIEKWTISVKAITPTINASSFGIGIGVRSKNNFTIMNSIFRWGWDTGTDCAFNMYPGNGLSNQLKVGSITNPSGGQTVYFDVTRNKNVYTCTAYQSDHTTVIVTGSFTMSLASGAVNQANNTGQFVIENFGGTNIKILEWTITTTAKKYVDYVFVGDSNMYGMFSGSNAVRFAEAAATAKHKTFEICAGIGDRSVDIVTRLNEIIGLHPRFVIASFGRNDIANGVATGTWQANIDTFVSTLQAAGIIVKSGGCIASNVACAPVQTYWTGKGLTGYDAYTGTKGGGTALNAAYDSGDNIHMNATGNGVVSTGFQTIM